MTTLRTQLIKLAHENPALKARILAKLAGARMASLKVIAHKPIMEREGLNTAAVKEGMAAMLYYIDAAENHSKFYEMLIVPESNTAVLKRRWGALTDSAATGKVAQKDEFFPSVDMAQRQMAKIYREKVGKGYKDAYNGKMHVSPTTGERLPMGQYPVGLTRNVGFGWGTQSATRCIPSLRDLQEKVDGALRELAEGKDLPEILADMEGADRIITALMRNAEAIDHETNRSMGDVLSGVMGPAMRRIKALQGQPVTRIMPDLAKLRSELVWINNYIRKQLSYCA